MDSETITIGNKPFSPEKVIETANSAANWFRTIGAFSVINAVLTAFNAQIVFVIGLGATMVLDALMMSAHTGVQGGALIAVTVAGYAFELMILGSVFLVWHLARKGLVWAYLVGAILYSLDSLIMLAVQDWVGVAFHAFFMFCIWAGLPAVRARKRAEAMISARSIPALPPELEVTSG